MAVKMPLADPKITVKGELCSGELCTVYRPSVTPDKVAFEIALDEVERIGI